MELDTSWCWWIKDGRVGFLGRAVHLHAGNPGKPELGTAGMLEVAAQAIAPKLSIVLFLVVQASQNSFSIGGMLVTSITPWPEQPHPYRSMFCSIKH